MKFFKLFSNCISVKGSVNSIICDLQRNDIYNITNEIYDLLESLKTKPLESLLKEYEGTFHPVIHEWISKLESQELGFFCDDPNKFPEISLRYETPEIINNCIIEFGKSSKHDWDHVFNQLSIVGCKFLELRIRKEISIQELEEIISKAKITNIRGIEIIWSFQNLDIVKQLRACLKIIFCY